MEENVITRGNLFVVDPNPPGGGGLEQIPPEDLFIYVKFSASPRSRQIFEGRDSNGNPKISSSGVADEVNFIATEIKYNTDGKIAVPKGKDNVDSYATTNWTGIGGLGTSSSGGLLEGFGIKSIDIKYNASLVPVVDITFTDVRGSGLFDVIKDNDRLSPYSLFFKMPYPVFKLSVKGYFGQTVEYCLHMVNWTSNFDGSTGNFDITANFLGFQQAFLNDMNIGNIIANVNTPEGLTELNRLNWTYKDDDDNEFTIKEDIRKIDDFFLKISRLQIDVENIKANSDELDELKDLNGQLKLLRQLRVFIGSPISKSNSEEDDKEISYLKMKNIEDQWFSSSIKDNTLENGINYLSIRDYLIINSINESAYKSYIKTLNEIINQYKEYVTNQEIKTNIANSKFVDSFFTGDDSYINYVRVETKKNNSISPENLKDIIDKLSNPPDPDKVGLSLQNDYDKNGLNNVDFNLALFQTETVFKNTLTKDTKCFIVDFRKQRATLENLIKTLQKDIKVKTTEVNEFLNEKITNNLKDKFGFNPTIENCFRILSNNTQAMTSTIYEITKKSSEINKKGRDRVLKGYSTDIPEVIDTSIAWPSVYRKNTDKSEEEIYIGEIDNQPVDTYFPEKVYVESIFNALVAREKALQQVTRATATSDGSDTDNWFPINPIDYNENPFRVLNLLTNSIEMKNTLANRIFLRVAILKNYSLFKPNHSGGNFTDYAEMDGINADLSIFSKKSRDVIDNLLIKINNDPTSLHDTEFFKVNVTEDGTNYKIDDHNEIGGVKIGGISSGVDFIEFDNDDIIENSKSLWKEIKEFDKYTRIVAREDNKNNKKESGDNFILQNYDVVNLVSKIEYNVWDKAVSKNLFKSNDNLNNYDVTSISDIDITGGTTDGEGKWINRTNFDIPATTECAFEKFMIDSDLYRGQSSKYGKALLLLSTLPLKTFKEGVLDVVFNGDYSGSRIIYLPKYYIYLIGGYLWNYRNDGIKWDINFSGNTECPYTIFSTPKNQYLTKLGYLSTTNKGDTPLEPELIGLPTQTQEKFIQIFKRWVNSNYEKGFESNVKTYRSDKTVSPGDKNIAIASLIQQFSIDTKMIVFAPKIFDQNNPLPAQLTVTDSDIRQYIKSFSTQFTKTNENNTKGDPFDEMVKVSKEKQNNKVKLAIYKYFKNINDKWVSDTEKSFSVCGENSTDSVKDLIDYFKFIDRGWGDIGQKASFNLNSFLTLSNNFKTSMYLFMSKLLRDSNFLFQILPTYINFKDAKEVAKIFQPITTIENNKSSGPIYACIYIGGASKVLDIKERNNYYFKNDGFSFPNPSVKNDNGDLPVGFGTEGEEFHQVAFRVAFGAENQTIFKNVSLNQQEHKETGEYFKALADLVDKRGGTQKTYQGTDLYKLFDTRSYTCKIDALGCMNIQPLMYFDLQNVPFFKGAYLITSVNHNITPNHMTTNFQGVRQSKFIAPPPTEITTDLNINLEESTETPRLELSNLLNKDKFVIGVLNPDEEFDFNKFTVDGVVNFKKMGVDTVNDLGDDPAATIKAFAELLNSNGIVSNKQVCMIMGNIMTVSNNMVNTDKKDKEEIANLNYLIFDDSTIYSGKKAYYDENPPKDVNSPFKTLSSVTPTFTSTTSSADYVARGQDEYLRSIDPDGLGNIYNSDKYFFAPRGYLYVEGRDSYFELYPEKFSKPFEIATTEKGAFQVAIDIWKNKKGQNGETAFETVGPSPGGGTGGANNFSGYSRDC